MAIYHCSVQIIGRNAGRSAVAAAAYRAGEDLINEYDGIEHDFTKKNWVEYTKILLPEYAPPKYSDRSTLWNAVELSEKSKDAQLCREFELALPNELSRQQQIEIVEQFAKEKLVAQGMVVDIAIHSPPVTNDRHQPIDANGNPTKDKNQMQFINPHAHIMATLRPMDEHGKWISKTQTEYLCIRNGEEKGFTADEFKKAKEEGWKKQYRFFDGKQKLWLTADEGHERGLERVNRSPKTTPYGRKNELIEYWNSKDRIFEWRQHWERVVNHKFEALQFDIRIDSRSFKDQGRTEELPSLHMGTSATNMEKRAERELHEGKSENQVIRSDIGNINRQIKEHNQFVRAFKEKMDAIVAASKDFVNELARKLEGIRAKMIGNHYEKAMLSQQMKELSWNLIPEGERLEKYRDETLRMQTDNEKAAKEIKALQKELVGYSPLQFRKRKPLQTQIQKLQEQIEDRKDYMQSIARMYGFTSDHDYQEAKQSFEIQNNGLQKMNSVVEQLQKDTEHLIQEYQTELKEIPTEILDELPDIRTKARTELEMTAKKTLLEKHKAAFSEDTFADARSLADKLLDIRKDPIIQKKRPERKHEGIEKNTDAVEKKVHHH